MAIMGSRGSGGKERLARGGGKKLRNKGKSVLEIFRDDARQLNEARAEAQRRGAAVLEYTDHTGKKHREYWDGARFTDRPNSMEAKYGRRSGTYTAQYEDRD